MKIQEVIRGEGEGREEEERADVGRYPEILPIEEKEISKGIMEGLGLREREGWLATSLKPVPCWTKVHTEKTTKI